jgi:hypothetical protein
MAEESIGAGKPESSEYSNEEEYREVITEEIIEESNAESPKDVRGHEHPAPPTEETLSEPTNPTTAETTAKKDED